MIHRHLIQPPLLPIPIPNFRIRSAPKPKCIRLPNRRGQDPKILTPQHIGHVFPMTTTHTITLKISIPKMPIKRLLQPLHRLPIIHRQREPTRRHNLRRLRTPPDLALRIHNSSHALQDPSPPNLTHRTNIDLQHRRVRDNILCITRLKRPHRHNRRLVWRNFPRHNTLQPHNDMRRNDHRINTPMRHAPVAPTAKNRNAEGIRGGHDGAAFRVDGPSAEGEDMLA